MVDTPGNRSRAQDDGDEPVESEVDPARPAVLDLSEESVADDSLPPVLESITLAEGFRGPVSIEHSREDARRRLAYILVGILGFTVAFSLFVFFLILMGAVGATVDDLVTVLNVLFAPVVALVGAATGFYFGASSQNQQGGR